MSDEWHISGEAGKALDETVRTLEEAQCDGLQINFGSLTPDEATWEVWLRNLDEAAGLLPEIGQEVTILLNGDRYFSGHVTGRKPNFSAAAYGYSITVSGPWYWLTKTPLSTEVEDETTVVTTRMIYLFDTGSPAAHLTSLAARAIAVGMPLQLGSIAACGDVPRLSIKDSSLSEAFAEVMRLVVDGLIYFDYSGGGNPALTMQRRATATVVTLDPAAVTISLIKITPRHDLQISEININYAEREAYGNTRATAFKTLTAGASAGGLPDRQIITVTGPELDLTLPQDLTDFVVVKSTPLAGHIGDALELWHDLLKAGDADVNVYTTAQVDVAPGSSTSWPTDPMLLATDSEGEEINLSEWPYYLTKGEIKDWFKKDGIAAVQARITATVASSAITGLFGGGVPERPKWARILGVRPTVHFVVVAGLLSYRYVWQATVSTVVPLVKTLWAEDTTLIRQEDWGWFNPPAGFADYLLETQNFVPWEGQVSIATSETPPANLVGSVLNITGTLPELADMKALISGYSVTPKTGEITFTLGPPARHAFRDLVNRFRQSGNDNIYWLDQAGTSGSPLDTILNEDGLNWEINEDNTTYPINE
jgi:hypothetical protein